MQKKHVICKAQQGRWVQVLEQDEEDPHQAGMAVNGCESAALGQRSNRE